MSPQDESKEAWQKRAAMANAKGFRLLYAAMKCFDLAEAAKVNAAKQEPKK